MHSTSQTEIRAVVNRRLHPVLSRSSRRADEGKKIRINGYESEDQRRGWH